MAKRTYVPSLTDSPLLYPGSLLGMNSSVNPSALSPEFAALITNGRLGDGVLTARNAGISIGTLPGSSSNVICGAYEFTLDGVLTWFLAIGDGTRATVYISIDSGVNWSSITPSSGPYGDMRIPNATADTKYVYMGVARDASYYGQATYDLVVLQNGTVAPRIYGKATNWSTALTPGTAGISSITQPSLTQGPFINYFSQEQPLPISSNVVTATTDGSGHVVAVGAGGGAPNFYWSTVFGMSTVAGNYAQYVLGLNTSWTNMSQATFILKTNFPNVLNYISISVVDSLGAKDVVYPNSVDYILLEPGNGPVVGDEVWYQLTVPIPPTTTTVDYSKIVGVKLIWTDSGSPSVNIQLDMFVQMAGGNTTLTPNYGGSFFGLAQMSSDFRSVGPGTTLARTPTTINLIGGSSLYSGVTFTESERIQGFYYTQWANQSSAQLAAGIDYTLVYRLDPGQTNYWWVGAERIATYSGSWANRRTTPFWFSSDLPSSVTDLAAPVQDFTKPLPPSDTVCMPIGKPMADANGRFFVGSGANLWFSRFQMPWMYRFAITSVNGVSTDDLQPGSLTKSGEIMQAIIPLGFIDVGQESIGAPPNSAASIHYLTDRGFYRVSGWDATSLSKSVTVAPYGTLSPFSPARSRLGFYWLDNTGQARRYNGNTTDPIGLKKIDNYTLGLSNPTAVTSCVVRDNFYLMIIPTQVIVFSEILDAWVSLDIPDFSNTAWCFSSVYNNYQRMVCFRSGVTTSGVFEHNSPTTPGTLTSFGVTFRLLHANYVQELSVADVRMAGDGATGKTFTATRSGQLYSTPAGIDASGTLTCAATGTLTDAFDDTGAGLAWYAVQISLSTTSIPGGYRIYAVSAITSATDVPATRS